jgi:C4-type Zn-finger protein
MARWVLSCPFCNEEFTYSEIPGKSTLADFFLPPKPDVPIEGVKLDCPSCQKTTTFFRHQMVYRVQ